MEFMVKERLVLFNILPSTGTLVNLRLIRELREALSFDDDENQRLGVRTEKEQIFWDDEEEAKQGPREVSIPATMLDLIVSSFGALDAEAKLHLDHVNVYERFLKERAEQQERLKALVDDPN